jgi:hypothetical protein
VEVLAMTGARLFSSGAGLLTILLLLAAVLAGGPSSKLEQSQPPSPLAPTRTRPSHPIPMPANPVDVQLALGLKDEEPTRWGGMIQISEGRIVSLQVQGPPNAKVTGGRFTARSFFPINQATLVRPKLHVSLDAPPTAIVTVKTQQGEFQFTLADLASGTSKSFLDGRVSVQREEGALRLTGPETEDDYPVMAKGPDGTVWLAYVAYQPGKPIVMERVRAGSFESLVPTGNGDQIRLMRFDGKVWHPAMEVTDSGLDVWRPAVAVDGQGRVVVAWSQQVDGDWEIFYRRYTPASQEGEGHWSDIVRLTQAPGCDFQVVAATDSKGTVWLAWQAWRKDNFDILLAALAEGHPWKEPKAVSNSKANDWSPALATDSKGNVYVAWDTYDQGNYDVRLHVVGKEEKTWTVAGTAKFEARPHLVCDAKDRLWIAYEEGDEEWGKDYANQQYRRIGLEKNPGYALYINRTVRVKCLVDGKIQRPAGDLQQALAATLKRNKSLPRLAVDAAGGVWLLVRHHPQPNGAGEVWDSYALCYDGRHWSEPQHLAHSSNLMDNRPALLPLGPDLLVVHSSDSRIRTINRDQNDLFATILHSVQTTAIPELVNEEPTTGAHVPVVHPHEAADLARIRAQHLEVGGKNLHLWRGEFHRHTEISSHQDQDGLLEDAWRYGIDAAALDWIGVGDHDNGFGSEYMWWLMQKTTDLYHHAPQFVGVHTYERSVVYPNGHRNVIMPRRGIRPLPRGELKGTREEGSPDTKVLYAYLKHFGGMCASHTSATQMGTDWRDNSAEFEPVVEIYQGHRHNYEHSGAPRSPTQATQIGGYEAAGFVWNALEKGYRLGFQCSSDHVSTHMSYAVLLTDDLSRQGVIDAFKKRHSYGATDNIVLVVRSGDHLMGDEFATTERPTLDILVEGTAPIAKLHVIRDNKYVYTTEPKERSVKRRYTDMAAESGKTHYYYVRIEQTDGNLAWASPLWITFKP